MQYANMKHAYILDGIRTPFGRYGGALSSIRADELAALPLTYLLKKYPHLDWSLLDDVMMGCANQAGEDNRNLARMASLLAGLPINISGTTINRLCGSGMDAIGQAARAIKSGESSFMLAGGSESMSRAPFVLPKAAEAFTRDMHLEDTTIGWRLVNPRMHALYGTDSMPETAENVAQLYAVSREDQDAFALASQQKYQRSFELGFFDAECLSVNIKQKKSQYDFTKDEHPRKETSLDVLANLKSIVNIDGTITAGNASGVNDGACMLMLGSDEFALTHKMHQRGRILGMAAAGVSPHIMGIGPVSASLKVLAQTGLKIDQMDVIELNEAFSAQAIAVLRKLNVALHDERVNPNGGAIAIGHPLGASGARLILTALRQLEKKKQRYALCTMCIGVGQGIAMIIERCE